jgi:hypothetical protein
VPVQVIEREATVDFLAETALLKDLLESNPNPVLVLDDNARVLHSNMASTRLFRPLGSEGRSPALAEYCGPARIYLVELVSGAIRSGLPLGGRDISIEDEVFHLSVHRGESAWIVTLRPITHELSRDYKLRRLEQHRDILLTAINGIDGSIVLADLSGTIRFMNEYTKRHIGDLLKGVPMTDWPKAAGFYRPDGVTPLEGAYRIVPRALAGYTIVDQPMVVRNEITGRSLSVSASAAPVRDGKGSIVGAIAWFRDVTKDTPSGKLALRSVE